MSTAQRDRSIAAAGRAEPLDVFCWRVSLLEIPTQLVQVLLQHPRQKSVHHPSLEQAAQAAQLRQQTILDRRHHPGAVCHGEESQRHPARQYAGR